MKPVTINNVNKMPNKIGDNWKDDSSDAVDWIRKYKNQH